MSFFTILLLAALSAVAREPQASKDVLALTRCYQCIFNPCKDDGWPVSAKLDQTNAMLSNRGVALYNKETKQNIQPFQVTIDVLIVSASPPASRPVAGVGRVPGFFVYAKGTPYFCRADQVSSDYEGFLPGNPFRIQLPGMIQPKGVRLQRYFPDNSLGGIDGMLDKELTENTPKLQCTDDLDFQEAKTADNSLLVLADLVRFSLIAEARHASQLNMPFGRDKFMRDTKYGCLRPEMPFAHIMRQAVYESWDIVNSRERSGLEKFFLPDDKPPAATDKSPAR